MALYRILERRRGAVWVCILVIYFAAFLFVASADEMNDDTEYQKKLAKMGKKAEAAAKKKRKVDAKLANRVVKAGECGDHVSNTLSASRYILPLKSQLFFVISLNKRSTRFWG